MKFVSQHLHNCYTHRTATVAFTVDRAVLAPGEHQGTLQVDCGIYSCSGT